MTVVAGTVQRFSVSLLLIVLAVLCFLLAAFGVTDKFSVNIVDVGLAFFAGSFIFGAHG